MRNELLTATHMNPQSVSDMCHGRANVKEAKAEKSVAHGQTGGERGAVCKGCHRMSVELPLDFLLTVVFIRARKVWMMFTGLVFRHGKRWLTFDV